MNKLGIDLGASALKLVLIQDDKIIKTSLEVHYGKIIKALKAALLKMDLPSEFNIAITGVNAKLLLSYKSSIEEIENIPAIVAGAKYLNSEANSIIEIGSESSRFITNIQESAPLFSINEHCAGGTGSFFEDQMSRLNLKIEDYSSLVKKATSIPNLSGRCAVFAKTDIIHRQQEGVSKEDILLGLSYAMIRNYKRTIVKTLPVLKPVLFCGGVTLNIGVIEAIKKVFKLEDNELIIPEYARYVGAIGSALNATKVIALNDLLEALEETKTSAINKSSLKKLELPERFNLQDPKPSFKMPSTGVYLGIDVGSTSTDLVLIDRDNNLIDFWYLRTKGDPLGVLKMGMKSIQDKYGIPKILGVGITGSGRERLGLMMKADAIRDEITAQAKAATYFIKDCDTVFEIGGQDSKYISIKDQEVVDFEMNKICAAGTGSFIEEQALRMNIDINDFGPLALTSTNPCDLGERCTVFIETAISSALASGVKENDIASGLCHSIVKNYLHKVVGNKKVGNKIVLQGGVDYNPGIVAAFTSYYGDRITVSPVFAISGAFGAALLAKEVVGNNPSSFLGFDFKETINIDPVKKEEIERNKALYKEAGKIHTRGYDYKLDPKKKTVGIPLSLVMFKFFPLANAFFKNLGFNVLLSKPTREETIELAQQSAHGETCYPVKLIYGHMLELAAAKVDYIFLPRVHTIRHPHSKAIHTYACPYMQMAAKMIFDDLGLEKQGIKLLSPVLDLEIGAKMMAKAMLNVATDLGFSKIRALKGLFKGAMAVRKNSSDVEAMGREILANLKPNEKVLVLITRNYGISDPILNMGIPKLLLDRGYKVITLGHLPGMALDLSKDYPNMYWPFGDHILSGAKLIRNHPNLYAVYLTNHGCGPDTIISHLFKEEMGDKPYLQIEVDEHYSKVGVITRIEAFLNSLSHHQNEAIKENFNILDVAIKETKILSKPLRDKKLLIPNLGLYSKYLIEYYNSLGYDAALMEGFDMEALNIGRAYMNTKEYLPLPVLLGSAIKSIKKYGEANLEFLIPFNLGADADGEYPRVIRSILDSIGYKEALIISPILELEAKETENFDLLLRAILTGDIIYSLDKEDRNRLMPEHILSKEELISLASKVERKKKKLGLVGSPLAITSLDEGVFNELENNYSIYRMPLAEMLVFLWEDNGIATDKSLLKELSKALGENSSFSPNYDNLFKTANASLDHFAANNGRYRFSKALEMGNYVESIISASFRYENTSVVLNLEGISSKAKVPLLELTFDGDVDESFWSKLNSFLYYAK